jgi:imidazolonepropionase
MRNDEFMRRIGGETYEEISLDGGGINNSVQEVRDIDESSLLKLVKNRMDIFLKNGTTTIEAKSGYGLNTESELKSLHVLKKVSENHMIDIVPTFMGAHTFPNDFLDNREGYVDLICNEMIPEVSKQGIAIFNDVFCEKGYFSPSQARKILNIGKKYGLKPRLHADEFSQSNAAELAAEVRSVSADHLMAVSDEGIIKMSENDVVGILLPGTTFSLGKSNYAPYRKLKENGVEIALATDFNPGSCFIQSMPFIMSLSCIFMKVSIFEALKACTYTAAKSLGLEKKIGSIEKGKNADILIWKFNDVNLIPSQFLNNTIGKVIKNGNLILQLD